MRSAARSASAREAFFNLLPISEVPATKLMELSFGLLLGGLLYLAVPEEAPAPADPVAGWQHFTYPLLAALTIAVHLYLPVRFSFTSAVAILLLILPRYPQLGWTLGFSVTLAAACFELQLRRNPCSPGGSDIVKSSTSRLCFCSSAAAPGSTRCRTSPYFDRLLNR